MKTALVTGSEGGLGIAICEALHAAGYRVVGTDRAAGSSSCDAFVALDLLAACSNREGLLDAVSSLSVEIGTEGLALLVNNAAVQLLNSTEQVTFADWHESVTVNLTAPLFLTQGLLAQLERAGGTVVNIGSVHARATKPRFVCYATTKAGLLGLTRAMAVDLGPRVRVLAVNPAAIDTEMLRAGLQDEPQAFDKLADGHPLRRIGTPADISKVVVFLASDDARFATGTAIDIDGGILSRLHELG